MAMLLTGEVRAILQPAGHAQYVGAYCPPGVPFREVRRGPLDGRKDIAVRVGIDNELPRVMTFDGGTFAYEYDGRDKDGRAVYRYAPNLSPAHVGIMNGVAEVYAEHALKQAGGQ
jgi:hypothetical protein